MNTRGHNVFEDLVGDCDSLALALRAGANEPLTIISEVALGAAIDRLLESVSKVSNARPEIGHTFELPTTAPVTACGYPTGTVRIEMGEDDILDGLDKDGYFDQFNQPARDRARAALAALNGVTFTIEKYAKTWTPIGLVDVIASTLQQTVTGTTDTSAWLKEE